MSKLAVVLLSDMKDPVKVEMAMRFALVAKAQNQLEDIRFFFFGPGVQVPSQLDGHPHLAEVMNELLHSGIYTVACIYNARQLEQEQLLTQQEIQMQGIGPELTGLIARGYQVMTF
jgi:hypothetical protein